MDQLIWNKKKREGRGKKVKKMEKNNMIRKGGRNRKKKEKGQENKSDGRMKERLKKKNYLKRRI